MEFAAPEIQLAPPPPLAPAPLVETKRVLRATWLSRAQHAYATELTLALLALLFLGAAVYLNDFLDAAHLMEASPRTVFEKREYWRVFTTLLAHADLGHVLSNALLFVPFSLFLLRHFSPLLFPLLGVACAAAANALVLLTLPPEATLVGASGLVYWMGGAWITLYALIEKREKKALRFAKALVVAGVLFVPDTLQPHVSHLAHYLGLLSGFASGYLTWRLKRSEIEASETWELVTITTPIDSEEWKNHPGPVWPT